MKSKITAVIIVLVLLAALVGIGALTYMNRSEAPDGTLVREVTLSKHPVQTRVAKPVTLVEKLASTGVLKAEQDVILTAEVGGKVQQVRKTLGDPCKKGDLYLQIDSESYRIGLAQAKAALTQSEVALDHAERDWRRMEKLKASAVVTAQQLDGAEQAVRAGRATVAQARAALKQAQRNVRETKVRCPFTGFVAERMIDPGQAVGPQTPLARLVDMNNLKLVLSVTSGKIGRLRVGQKVTLSDPNLPGQTFSGAVSRLGVAADPQTRTFPVEVKVNQDESGLRAGQVIHVSLELEEHRDVLAVPIEALIVATEQKSVLVVNGESAKKVPVEVGPQIEGDVIIRSGLKPNDEVIVMGGNNLVDGDAIEVVAKADSAPAPAQTP